MIYYVLILTCLHVNAHCQVPEVFPAFRGPAHNLCDSMADNFNGDPINKKFGAHEHCIAVDISDAMPQGEAHIINPNGG
jgi:hypothetical protein